MFWAGLSSMSCPADSWQEAHHLLALPGVCVPCEGEERLWGTPGGLIPAGNTGLEPIWSCWLVLQAPEGIGESIPTPCWHAVGIPGRFKGHSSVRWAAPTSSMSLGQEGESDPLPPLG